MSGARGGGNGELLAPLFPSTRVSQALSLALRLIPIKNESPTTVKAMKLPKTVPAMLNHCRTVFPPPNQAGLR